jgi:hypothetical protein
MTGWILIGVLGSAPAMLVQIELLTMMSVHLDADGKWHLRLFFRDGLAVNCEAPFANKEQVLILLAAISTGAANCLPWPCTVVRQPY